MAIAEFEARVGVDKRITIPRRINVKLGDRVLVKIYPLEKEKGSFTKEAATTTER